MERQARRALEDPEKGRWTPLSKRSRSRPTYAIHDLAEAGKIRWVERGAGPAANGPEPV